MVVAKAMAFLKGCCMNRHHSVDFLPVPLHSGQICSCVRRVDSSFCWTTITTPVPPQPGRRFCLVC